MPADTPPRKGGPDPSIRGFIKETARDTGYRKAAQFLMLVGKDEAVRVLKHMSPEEVEGITREIARTNRIEEKEASKILEEFGYILQTRDLIARGGIEKAQEMLTASVGPEKAEKIIERVRRDMAPPPFSFLQDIEPHQAIALVRQESPPVVALVVAHLDPRLAARILLALPPEAQRDVAGRVAKMGKVDPEVIRATEEGLRKKVRAQGQVVTQEVDGKAALTEILRHMDPAKEKAILEELEPNTANEIRKKLYTIDVVFQLADRDLQRVLRDYADRDLALVVKGAEEAVRARILGAVSERRRDFIRLEAEGMGAVLKSEVTAATDDLLAYIQVLEQKGELAIVRDAEEYV